MQEQNRLDPNLFQPYAYRMTKLDTYLKTRTGREFARLIGVSEAYISDLRKAKRSPSLAIAFAIEDATGGEVPARSWLDHERAN